jgi:hypothetical protein
MTEVRHSKSGGGGGAGICNFFLNNLFNLSSFTVSEANYRLTRGYHGIAFSL